MKSVISQLQVWMETLEHNERINRSEGNVDQANLEAATADEVREAIAILGQRYRNAKPDGDTMKPAFWFSAEVYKHEFCPAFAEEKPHDDGDWQPVYLDPRWQCDDFR